MSGDDIRTLKLPNEPIASSIDDLNYVEELLRPFDDVVERFQTTQNPESICKQPISSRVVVFLTVALVLLINFPKVQDRINLNNYLAWIMSTFLLVGVLF